MDTWGSLPKSQIDDETIEEAIARIVDEHNADETAHLELGQSLQSHKASDIIDHLASSIIADKLAGGSVPILYGKRCIYSNFDSLDGLSVGGVGTEVLKCVLGGSSLQTGNVNNDTAFVRCNPNAGFGDNPNFDKNPILSFRIKVMDRGYAECHCHIGYSGFQNSASDYVGFKFYQNHIYCVSCSSSGSLTSFDLGTTINSESIHDYRVEIFAGINVLFYIDDVLVHETTTNVPTGDNESSCFFFGVKNSLDGGEQTLGVFLASYQETI